MRSVDWPSRKTHALVLLLGCACIFAEVAVADISLGPGFEPTIAVNPLDPDNIAMARLGNARVSVDGGTTWSTETAAVVPPGYGDWQVPVPPMPPGIDASLAFDSQGRLFWSYLAAYIQTGAFDIFVCELNPETGVILAGPFLATNTGAVGYENDKEWLVADTNPISPFADRIYLGWTRFPPAGLARIMSSYSTDHGRTWSAPLQVSIENGLAFGAHFAIPRSGDVYLAYQVQTYPYGCNGNGTTGRVYVVRSTDGGVSYSQRTLAFDWGEAEVPLNQQNCIWPIPGVAFWNYTEPWILADPTADGSLYVVAADDPDNVLGSGDAGDVFIVRSEDHGLTWSDPAPVSDGPAGTLEFLPRATIDPVSGWIAVSWYDNRSGAVNSNNNYLLDYRYAISGSGGRGFTPSFMISDEPFDPDDGVWFLQHTSPPPPTNWIGEYFGLALRAGILYAAWTGNGEPGEPQETIFDRVSPTVAVPAAAGPPPPGKAIIRSVHPEPFAEEVVIEYGLSEAGPARLTVYDITGREVRTLVDALQDIGFGVAVWDGRTSDGAASPAGVYIVRLESGGEATTKKVVLAR